MVSKEKYGSIISIQKEAIGPVIQTKFSRRLTKPRSKPSSV